MRGRQQAKFLLLVRSCPVAPNRLLCLVERISVIIDINMTNAAKPQAIRLRLNENGRIVIPASIREAVGLKRGQEVILWAEKGEVRISTAAKRIQRAQELVRKYVPEGVSLSDELIAERRREAAGE
jgi:AbrB family looped-hinge helix DNA binding protein